MLIIIVCFDIIRDGKIYVPHEEIFIMLVIDCETTGLLKASIAKVADQPKITELSVVKTDDELNFIDEIEFLFDPGFALEPEITKLTGITDAMLSGKPAFVEKYEEIAEFFLGEKTVVAHNCPFDMGMIYVELARLEKEFKFPWPMNWICTVEKTFHLKHRRLRLAELHEMATGNPHDEKAHRAKEDVYALIRCFAWMKKGNLV